MFLWIGLSCGFSVWVWLVEIILMDSGCLVGLCEGDHFLLPEIQVYVEHIFLALWMRVWITDSFAKMG